MFQWAGRRSGRARVAIATFLVASGALGVTVHASEPPVPDPVEAVPVETGELDGAIVAVGLPPVPPVDTVAPVDTAPVETGEVDGATVAVGLPPVPPPPAPAAPAAPAPDPAPGEEPADEPVDVDGVGAILADATASAKAAERLVGRFGF